MCQRQPTTELSPATSTRFTSSLIVCQRANTVYRSHPVHVLQAIPTTRTARPTIHTHTHTHHMHTPPPHTHRHTHTNTHTHTCARTHTRTHTHTHTHTHTPPTCILTHTHIQTHMHARTHTYTHTHTHTHTQTLSLGLQGQGRVGSPVSQCSINIVFSRTVSCHLRVVVEVRTQLLKITAVKPDAFQRRHVCIIETPQSITQRHHKAL